MEIQVIRLIKENTYIKRKEIVYGLDVSEHSAKYNIDFLKETGRIEQRSLTRLGTYVVRSKNMRGIVYNQPFFRNDRKPRFEVNPSISTKNIE